MNSTDYTKVSYLFEGITERIPYAEMVKAIHSFIAIENPYVWAIFEISAKPEILNGGCKYHI